MLSEKNLHAYQWTCHDHIIETPKAGLFLEMGLGKTVTTLTAIDTLIYKDMAVDKVLVVGPKRVVESVWAQEVRKWSHLQHLNVTRVIGTQKQRIKALKEESDIYLISRDNIAWLVAHYGGRKLPFDMLVIDESSSFKNPKSIRFKSLRRIDFKRVVILTGTPAPNTLIDLWSQIYLLDKGKRLGKFITHFRQEFFRPGASNGHIVYKYLPQKNAKSRIFDRIGDICLSMKSEDYLNLPKRIDNYIDIHFPTPLQQKYDAFAEQQVLLLFEQSEAEISAVNAAALANKLLQFAGGSVYDEDKEVHEVHKLKLEALEEIVENANGQPVLVAYNFQHERDRIMKRLKKYKPVQLKTDQHVEQWNRGEIPVMVMHPASGGHGLNLQSGGNIIVWFGMTWSLELYQQFNARLHRQGQNKPVIIHHLIAHKTIDGRVRKALENKSKGQEALMQAVKATIEKYRR